MSPVAAGIPVNPQQYALDVIAFLRPAVRNARAARHHTQTLVAQMVGTSPTTISSFERDKSTPPAVVVLALLAYVGQTPDAPAQAVGPRCTAFRRSKHDVVGEPLPQCTLAKGHDGRHDYGKQEA